jgi:GH15 family glucan-1,4-alpha-glucosidase
LDFPIHNPTLRRLIRASYRVDQIADLTSLLRDRGILDFPALANGLFPASTSGDAHVSGYGYVWVRDNIQIAAAHFLNGATSEAVATVRSLSAYFAEHRERFTAIINGIADPAKPMNRPHVRFDGKSLQELPDDWAHAQNDALGYYLWLISSLVAAGISELEEYAASLAGLFVEYFNAIRFWADEDSGHWEEARKIEASSIGVVTAGLSKLKAALLLERSRFRDLAKAQDFPTRLDLVEELVARGQAALDSILPNECIQNDPRKFRACDGAQLFLIYPAAIISEAAADTIIERVLAQLAGEFGIRRYRGDSYWCANYKRLLPTGQRSRNVSETIAERDALLSPGEEAQWCIFDPILSAIYANRYLASRNAADRERQLFFLNRALGQVTPDFRCPEAYYLEDGVYVPNDNSPLLWSQANLWTSLHYAQVTAARA